jgi:hypothetical protein
MNRGNNLLVSGFLVALAIGVTGVMVSESEWIDRLDDVFIIILALIAAIWHLRADYRYTWSLVPLGLLIFAFTGKLIGFALEIGDPASAGDELGILPTIGAMLIIGCFVVGKSYPGRTAEKSPRDVDENAR